MTPLTEVTELYPSTDRSDAQKVLHSILHEAENRMRQGKEHIEAGLEMFSLIATPKHPTLPAFLEEQLEQIRRYER